MYYRNYYRETNDFFPAKVWTEKGTITINPFDKKNRLYFTYDREYTYNNVNDILKVFPEDERAELKKKIFHAAKEKFYEIDHLFPDASTGVTLFLLGKDYRILGDDKYSFELDYSFRECRLEDFLPFVLDQYLMRGKSYDKWPLALELRMKSKNRLVEKRYMFDVYNIHDVFFSSVRNCESVLRGYTFDGDIDEYHIRSFPRYNRVEIYFGGEKITQNYDIFQLQNIGLISAFLKYLTDSKEYWGQASAAFFMDTWQKKEDNSDEQELEEQSRLIKMYVEKNYFIEPGFLGDSADYLMACGIRKIIERDNIEDIDSLPDFLRRKLEDLNEKYLGIYF